MPSRDLNPYRCSRITLCSTTPLTLHDEDDGGDDDDTALLVRRHPYNKLPHQLFNLSVLKLDGSLFGIQVKRNATVADLKQAVEEVFISSPKDDQEEISWLHVWGHFCLCYDGQKLISDKASVKNIGIKDGDQLQFIRHLSINHKLSRRLSRTKSFTASSKRRLSGSNTSEEIEHSDIDDNFEDEGGEIKGGMFLKRWLTYSKLQGSRRASGRNRSSRFTWQWLSGRRANSLG